MASSCPCLSQVKRPFLGSRDWHCIFCRFDKRDVMFTPHLCIALVVEALR
jgi:hypothetical protein